MVSIGLKRKLPGFTIVEVMVVVLILGILSSIAIPSFKQLIESQRAKNASADLHAALTRTRSEALKRNTSVMLAPVAGAWQNGWEISVSGNVLESHGSIGGTLTVTGPANVTYRSSGRIIGDVTPTPFQIAGTYSGSMRCVHLDLSGRPSTKAGSC